MNFFQQSWVPDTCQPKVSEANPKVNGQTPY